MDRGQGPGPGLRGTAALLLLALAGCGGSAGTPAATPSPTPTGCEVVVGTPSLTSQVVAQGLSSPLDLEAPPGDHRRLFVVEQAGRIRVVRDGSLLAAPFLDISDRVRSGGEQGLLGLAFHPRYTENGRFFVDYTDLSGNTRVAEFRVTADPDRADPASERLVLGVQQPFANHNGGRLVFGPDGMLYVGMGDGGSAGDPMGNGQNLGTLLGKILRIDVDGATPYGVPSDNPFLGVGGARPEIWAYGLRNPWRFAFDAATGDLWIGDVGQDTVEEIDVGLASRHGGENYGWNVTEGSRCFRPATGCSTAGFTLPVFEYGHDQGCSVTGGVVYRGCRMPGYHGTYFYGDYCSGFVRSFRLANGAVTDQRDWSAALGRIRALSSFGVDADGEIYLLDYGSGEARKIVPQ